MNTFYKKPIDTDDIQQGDIFKDLPFTELSLDEMVIYNDEEPQISIKSWEQVKDNPQVITSVKILKKTGIVITQDCDNLRNDFISLALVTELTTLSEINRTPPRTDLKWTEYIKGLHKRYNYRIFYLPENIRYSIRERMCVDLDVIFQLPKDNLLARRTQLRKAKLGEESIMHFRDNLSKYFTRYANNEWYS